MVAGIIHTRVSLYFYLYLYFYRWEVTLSDVGDFVCKYQQVKQHFGRDIGISMKTIPENAFNNPQEY